MAPDLISLPDVVYYGVRNLAHDRQLRGSLEVVDGERLGRGDLLWLETPSNPFCGITDVEAAALLDLLWGGDETLIVVSSDLSHELDYDSARRLDEETSEAIAALEPERIAANQACGRIGIRGLLTVARRRGLGCRVLDVRNSGDTTGPHHRVVGYGAYAFG